MSMTTTGTIGVEGYRGGMITKLVCFYENHNGILLHLITYCYLSLACFSVVSVYIPLQKLFLIFLTQNPKTLYKMCRYWYQKAKMAEIKSQEANFHEQVIIYPL